MKHLTINDLERLAREIGQTTENYESWAERSGFDPELLVQLGNVATNMVHEQTMEMARQAFFESTDDPVERIRDIMEDEDEQTLGIKMDVGDIIRDACISMFALGYETHRQFGGVGIGRS